MKRRWRLRLTLLLILLGGVSLLHPAVHWRLLGWARGEAFYDGRPTSWWVEDIEKHFSAVTWTQLGLLGSGQEIPPELWQITDWTRSMPPPWWEWRPSWWGGDNANQLVQWLVAMGQAPLVNGDPTALPVLLELLRRPELKARQVAVTGLEKLARQEPAAMASLRAAANDPDPAVRRQVQQSLERLDERIPEPAAAP
jgi:hypothetical protein